MKYCGYLFNYPYCSTCDSLSCSFFIRSLSNEDGDAYENVTYKVTSHCFKLSCAYSISLNSSNVGKFFLS